MNIAIHKLASAPAMTSENVGIIGLFKKCNVFHVYDYSMGSVVKVFMIKTKLI
jgi:hypothetical protein